MITSREVQRLQVGAYHINYVAKQSRLPEEEVRAFAKVNNGFYKGSDVAITRECFADILKLRAYLGPRG